MLKMALQQFVCRFTLLTILLCSGCPPVVVTDNSALVDNGSPRSSPWMAYLYQKSNLTCVGSLITDQWLLTQLNCVTSHNINKTEAVLGIQNRSSDNPNAVTRKLVDLICNYDFIKARISGICLVKLSSPVNFTNDIQAIPLASNTSTFYNATSTWGSVFDTEYPDGTFKSIKEVEASSVSNDQCKFQGFVIDMAEREMCVQLEGSSPCQTVIGSPLITKERCQWVLLGVYVFISLSCNNPVIFTHVFWYQDWIHKVITGTEPTFVTVISTGSGPNENFTCSTEISTTSTSITSTTVIGNNSSSTATPTTIASTTTTTATTTTGKTRTTTTLTPTTTDDSIFSGCDNLSHFTHFFSLSSLVLFLHVLVGGSGM